MVHRSLQRGRRGAAGLGIKSKLSAGKGTALPGGSFAAVKGGEREAKQAGLPFGPGRWSWAGWEKRKNGGGGKEWAFWAETVVGGRGSIGFSFSEKGLKHNQFKFEFKNSNSN